MRSLHYILTSEGRHAEPFRDAEPEPIEQRSLCLVGADDAAQSQVASRHRVGWQNNVGAVNGGEFLEDSSRAVAQPSAALPLLEGFPHRVGEKADQDVAEHAILLLMPDRPDRQVALVDAECRLGLTELDVGSPQRLRRPVGDVGAQHIAAFAVARPVVPFGLDRPIEPEAARCGGILDEADGIASCGARVAPEKTTDLALRGAAVHRLLCPRQPLPETGKPGLDAFGKTLMHGELLLLAFRRADQQERRAAAIGRSAQLGLDAIANLTPIARIDELGSKLLHVALVGADEIATPAAVQPCHGLGTGHAAIHHPDARGIPVTAFHRRNDLFDSGYVGAIAGKHLVAERYAVTGHDKADADLLAIAPLIAAVATLGHRVGRGLALEVGAGHVVEQKLVVEPEQRTQPVLEM